MNLTSDTEATNANCDCRSRQADHDEIARQTKEFLKKKGKITQVEYGHREGYPNDYAKINGRRHQERSD